MQRKEMNYLYYININNLSVFLMNLLSFILFEEKVFLVSLCCFLFSSGFSFSQYHA